jgi:hypothetical protein
MKPLLGWRYLLKDYEHELRRNRVCLLRHHEMQQTDASAAMYTNCASQILQSKS